MSKANAMKKGYKQTIYGPIPSDWIECKFEDVFTGFSSGQTPYRAISRYYDGDIPWITSGELNYNKINDTIEKITNEAVRKTNLKILPKGTFLFAITGLEAEGTRGSCAVTGIEATTNQSCMALFPKQGLVTTDYLFQFYVKYGNWLAFNFCQGTKQQSYTGGIAKKLPIVLPPTIAEQTAIATALSDMDNLIAGLEQLIAKKKAIKQGAMQELLRPKAGWCNFSLGQILESIADYTANGSFEALKNNVKYYSSLNYAVLVRTTDLDKEIFSPERFTDRRGYEYLAKTSLYGGEIVIANVGSLGKVFRVPKFEMPMTLAPNTYLLKFKKSVFEDFIFQWLNTNEFLQKLLSKIGSTTLQAINKDNLRSIELCMPESLEEQKSIASTLMNLDSEIALLEKRLSKQKLLKQGMMQELLTGKTRLV